MAWYSFTIGKDTPDSPAKSQSKSDLAKENQELREVIREMNTHIEKVLGSSVADQYRGY